MSALEFSQLLGNYGEFVGAIAIAITLWNICIWRQQQTNFFQAQDRLLDVQTLDEQSSIVRTLMQYPSSRRFWARQKKSFDSRFVTWIHAAIESDRSEG